MPSVKLPTFPNIDFSKLDLSKLPKFEMPKFEMPKFDVPNVDLPTIDTAAVTNAVKDVTYVTIGLAVLAFQKAQVRRGEFAKSFAEQAETFETKLDEVVVEVEKRLPERAGALLGQAHDAAKAARKQVRGLLTSAAV